MNEQYKSGWNLRVNDANAKLPRNSKKNEEFLQGFWDCNDKFMIAISRSIQEGKAPVYPELIA